MTEAIGQLHDIRHEQEMAVKRAAELAEERTRLSEQLAAIERTRSVKSSAMESLMRSLDEARQGLQDAMTLREAGMQGASIAEMKKHLAQAEATVASAMAAGTAELEALDAAHADIEVKIAAAEQGEQDARQSAIDAEAAILKAERDALLERATRSRHAFTQSLVDISSWNLSRGLLQKSDPANVLASIGPTAPQPEFVASLNGPMLVTPQRGIRPIDAEADRLLEGVAYWAKVVNGEVPGWLQRDLGCEDADSR